MGFLNIFYPEVGPVLDYISSPKHSRKVIVQPTSCNDGLMVY